MFVILERKLSVLALSDTKVKGKVNVYIRKCGWKSDCRAREGVALLVSK